MHFIKKVALSAGIIVCLFVFAIAVNAGTPSGTNWFQLLASPYTGVDNTGDGGTGLADDFNYYYVGQTWTKTIQISSDHTNASNIWIDYDGQYVSTTGLSTGTYFPTWSGVTTTLISGTDYRMRMTGYRTEGYFSGLGTFGSFQITAHHPSVANYGTSSPQIIDINIGNIGSTTESNISYLGNDILEDAEDFQIHIWADTKKPYALNSNPINGGTGFSIDGNYTFDLRDSKNGEGDNSGVGTGVNTATGALTFNTVNYLPYTSYSCSGIWGTNLCVTTVNPTSPSGIPGDSRNWNYNTTYTVNISNYQDRASTNQNQLGDINGPNSMDTKTWTFTTESDTVAPRVQAESPARGSSGNSVSTDVYVEVVDKKTYPSGPSGTGVNSATCKIRIQSPTFGNTVYTQGDAGVTVSAINYGYSFNINPATDFGQNETVSVSVYDCEDLVSNVMTTDNYTFSTIDSGTPYIELISPLDNDVIAQSATISFHIKDDGTGVDLNNTVVYVNGVYYTNSGGAGVVTNSGTKITYSSSQTYAISGTANDYTITITPSSVFAVGESVPIIIYTRDLSGNLMERYVYSVSVSGGGCPLGSSYCGSNTSWSDSLLLCVGTGGGSVTPPSSGGSSPTASINPSTAGIVQIDENSVLITWYSSMAGDARVIYGDDSPVTMGSEPNYNYDYSTETFADNSTYHSVVVNGLEPGKLYYFKPITTMAGNVILGSEMSMAPVYKTSYIGEEKECPVCPTCPTCPVCPTTPTTVRPTTPATPTPISPPVIAPSEPESLLEKLVKILNIKINDVSKDDSVIIINGTAQPSSKLLMTIY
jgi:hypothetical protein